MKKLLLTTALVGVAFAATPAMAEVSLGLGGHFKGYMSWVDQDEDDVTDAEVRSLDILRETEIHFTGETTLDNGLTVGFHAETEADRGDGLATEESYAYFAGNWGRVNFGAEDGANYLLQVAAPAADSNVDGIRQYINAVDTAELPISAAAGAAVAQLDYAADASGYEDKLTYISPVFNGFQAGVSYTPDVGAGATRSFGNTNDDVEDALGEAYEAAVRYEGQFNAVRLALGAGYTHVEIEQDADDTSDDQNNWNVGANLGFGPFNVGAAYVTDTSAVAGSFDTDTWVIGADYTTGPFVIGASYLNRDDDNFGGGTDDLESERYSGGVTYTYGPGMSFRGSVHHVEHDLAATDGDGTSLLLGTQIGF